MKSKLLIIIVLFLLLLQSISLSAQFSVNYYTDSTLLNFNTRIVDIKENPKNGELYLLGKIENEEFTNVEGPWFARVGIDAKLIFSKGWYEEGLNDVRKLLLLPDNNKMSVAKIYGSSKSGQTFKPYYKVIDKKAESPSQLVTINNASTLLKSVCDIGQGQSYELWSLQGANQLYNIRIKLTNTLTGIISHNIKMQSAFDEEAESIAVINEDSSIIVLAKRFDSGFNNYNSVLYRIGAAGDSIWSKEMTGTKNYRSHAFCVVSNADEIDDKLAFIYTTSDSQTKLQLYDLDAKKIKELIIKDLEANGILALNGKLLVYGSKMDTVSTGTTKTVVSRAAIQLFDNNLKLLKQYSLTENDKPDTDIKGIIARPCATEILCATKLNDGRIALGGRTFMPKDCSATGIGSTKTNRPLLILLDENFN